MKKALTIPIAIFLILTMVQANMETQIIAHRTNTIAEIEQAIKTMETPIVEIDVRKINSQFVASHDRNPAEPPTIKQIITKFKNKTKFHFDLKEKGNEIEFTEFLLKELKPSQFAITSKSLASLKKIKQHSNQIELGLIIPKKDPFTFIIRWLRSRLNPKTLIKPAAQEGFHIIPDYRFVNARLLKTAKDLNAKVIPWTVNRKNKINQLAKKDSIGAIVTDYPEIV